MRRDGFGVVSIWRGVPTLPEDCRARGGGLASREGSAASPAAAPRTCPRSCAGASPVSPKRGSAPVRPGWVSSAAVRGVREAGAYDDWFELKVHSECLLFIHMLWGNIL